MNTYIYGYICHLKRCFQNQMNAITSRFHVFAPLHFCIEHCPFHTHNMRNWTTAWKQPQIISIFPFTCCIFPVFLDTQSESKHHLKLGACFSQGPTCKYLLTVSYSTANAFLKREMYEVPHTQRKYLPMGFYEHLKKIHRRKTTGGKAARTLDDGRFGSVPFEPQSG